MKKTININLNQQIYYLDIDAYDELEKYLNSIKKYFKTQNSLEVVEDIESRIAEKFNEIINKSKKAIQIADVEKIINEMGTVDDITEEAKIEEEPEKIKKKLFRDPDTKIIAGVVTGISQYFGINKPIWLRIIFFILLINPKTFWLAIIGYIAAWLIIPEAKTNWEKLEMKGKPTTINELQSTTEEKTSTVVSTLETIIRNVIQKLFSIFGYLIKFCWVWFCRLSGFFGLVFTILTIMTIVVGMIFVYLCPNLPFFNFSFVQNIGTPWLEVAYITLGLITISPLVFVIDLADSLMRLKWRISTQKITILLAVWIISLITFCGVAKINYPKYKDNLYNSIDHLKYINHIDENNSETLPVEEISDIDISSVKEVKITESDENEVKIIGNKSIINELSKNYEKGKLIITGESEKWFNNPDNSGYVSSVRVEIKTRKVNSLKLDNNIDAWFYPINNNLIDINVGSRVGLKIEGILNKAIVKIGPASVVNMLEAKTSEIDVSLNNGVIKTQAKKIKITGNKDSTLVYKGTPDIIKDKNNKTNQMKYILSEDYSKIDDAVKNTFISINGTKSKIGDLIWSTIVAKQSDDNLYNIFTSVKLKANDTSVYILWLTEKDGLITLKNSLRINNWESMNYLDVLNDKTLKAAGQIYGSKFKTDTIEVYINKINGTLQIQPNTEILNTKE